MSMFWNLWMSYPTQQKDFADVIILRTLKCENYPKLSGWGMYYGEVSNVITRVLKRWKRWRLKGKRVKERDVMTEAEIWVMQLLVLKAVGKVHEPRNAGGLQKAEKSRKWILRACAILSTPWFETSEAVFRLLTSKRVRLSPWCLWNNRKLMSLVIKWPVSYEMIMILDVNSLIWQMNVLGRFVRLPKLSEILLMHEILKYGIQHSQWRL